MNIKIKMMTSLMEPPRFSCLNGESKIEIHFPAEDRLYAPTLCGQAMTHSFATSAVRPATCKLCVKIAATTEDSR